MTGKRALTEPMHHRLVPFRVVTERDGFTIYAIDRDDALAFLKSVYRGRLGTIKSVTSRQLPHNSSQLAPISVTCKTNDETPGKSRQTSNIQLNDSFPGV